jgi:hypothetical protein
MKNQVSYTAFVGTSDGTLEDVGGQDSLKALLAPKRKFFNTIRKALSSTATIEASNIRAQLKNDKVSPMILGKV